MRKTTDCASNGNKRVSPVTHLERTREKLSTFLEKRKSCSSRFSRNQEKYCNSLREHWENIFVWDPRDIRKTLCFFKRTAGKYFSAGS
jgi:hypothetical protein